MAADAGGAGSAVGGAWGGRLNAAHPTARAAEGPARQWILPSRVCYAATGSRAATRHRVSTVCAVSP
ncbi:hypothetical protein Stsp01_53380 [Streptomyces sp. NBRC 13847]|nr:hypothetical protein Stsp01_53380 [Streptomyces sp. NBRC 13847]